MEIKKILILVLLVFVFNSSNAFVDSVGVIKVKGDKYILHKVEAGQGLYAISRRYNISVDQIKRANGDTLNSLDINQIVFIPLTKVIKVEKGIDHRVKKGETLFQISQKYAVKVTDIKKWNKLTGNSIHEGDNIIIIKYINKVVLAKDYYKTENKIENKIQKNTEKENTKITENDNKIINPNERIEDGIVTWINDETFGTKKSLALHKNAPLGTIIKITSQITEKSTFVKVVGNLPKGSKEIIKISKYSAKQIGLKDKMSRVKLLYYSD
ncbi:MAG: LysM peptidoglycan-binding domain-containing protein [Bacteroidota bacterium]|nr:LysM peptidoglycan-binding domain-containing protein [Bacteroidota bacterium]